MLEDLKKEVYKANVDLFNLHLALFTWGNASAIDRAKGLIVIKPSGIPYDAMTASDMVVVNMEGKVVEGTLKPSSDLRTHLVLYSAFEKALGIVHTHSTYATAWAQAGTDLPAEGTTHADHFLGAIPCTRHMTKREIESEYEWNTGQVIIETFRRRRIDPVHVSAVLVRAHGPFVWGNSAIDALHNAEVLEELAKIGILSRSVGNPLPIQKALLLKHFYRKHGNTAYYGQK